MNKVWQRALGYFAMFLTILTAVITVTINFRPLYRFDIDYLNITEITGFSKEILLKNFAILMRYLNFPWIKNLSTPDFPMSESGAFHFYEVKQLFTLNYVLLLILIIPAVYFLIRMFKTGQNWRLHGVFKIAAIVPVAFGALMALGFDQFFVSFHQVFFNNDDWLFDPATDPIIMALPEEFFMHCFILAFVLLEVIFIVGLIVTRTKKKAK
ncbi:TIGR01906 family membrane protein [Enterococcus timonensis]|uniref:TIGR01906 family membrane protein n=1 Tax=Enterococcus timonensis TaxID=1852364 RepID=UPI0008D8F875|nr:TIGR01906 family membrane protein [Enterococcus timonensis]